jgi:hypothetical protein
MSDSDDPKLPGAQVTPPLAPPLAQPDDPDDESPTIQISPGSAARDESSPRWSGSATVPPPGTPRRRTGLSSDDEDTYDLPADEDYGPTFRERLRVWRSRWRRPAVVAAPTQAPAQRPPAAPAPRPPHPPIPGPPPGWYGPPPGYPPPGGPPTRWQQAPPGGPPTGRQQGPPTWAGQRGAQGPPAAPPDRRTRPSGRRPSSNRPPVNPYPPAPPAPRRRRRRWPWWMLFWLIAIAACCGGVTLWGRPFIDEYPASIANEADVPGLTRSTDAGRQRTADKLLTSVESEQWDEESVTVLYTDQRQRGATLLATTRFVFDPEKALTDRFATLTGELQIKGDAEVEAGALGGYRRCGTGTLNNRTVAVCGWADHGSLAVGVFGGRSVTEAAQLLDAIRPAVLKRG